MKKALRLIIVVLLCCNIVNAQSGWQTVPNAPVVGRFDDVSFINSMVGWCSSGIEMFKTTDAGITWDTISNLPAGSGYVRSVEFINDTIGFYGTLRILPDPAGLYRTVDGGVTFTNITSSLPIVTQGICGMAHYGNIVTGVGAYYEPGMFYKSTDAGLTWTYVDLSAYATALIDIYMFDQNNYLACGKSTVATGERANILRTNDGGATWQQVAICSAAGLSYIWKMFFLANGVGFASVEEQPIILKTIDYGMSWNEITISNPNAIALGAIGAINDSMIWVGRQYTDGMFESINGGLTWNYYPNFGNSMDRMVLLDATHIICGGSTIYKYTQGGPTGIFNPHFDRPHHNLAVVTNPVTNGTLSIELTIYQSTFGTLSLINTEGKIVQQLFKDAIGKGKVEKTFSVKDLKSGAYTLLFRSNEEFISKKIEIIK